MACSRDMDVQVPLKVEIEGFGVSSRATVPSILVKDYFASKTLQSVGVVINYKTCIVVRVVHSGFLILPFLNILFARCPTSPSFSVSISSRMPKSGSWCLGGTTSR